MRNEKIIISFDSVADASIDLKTWERKIIISLDSVDDVDCLNWTTAKVTIAFGSVDVDFLDLEKVKSY